MENFLPILISVLCSALIAIVGWNVLFKNAKKLASRSETYSVVSSTMSLLYELLDISENFWLSEKYKNSPRFYDTIIAIKLRNIQNLLGILCQRDLELGNTTSVVVKIRRSCTLQSNAIATLSDVNKIKQLQNINSIIIQLEDDIYRAYIGKHKIN